MSQTTTGLPENIKDLIERSTVNPVCVDGDDRPAGGASGCLVDYYGKRILLTVEHNTDIPRGFNFYVVLGWDEQARKTKLREPGTLNYASQGMLAKDAVDRVRSAA